MTEKEGKVLLRQACVRSPICVGYVKQEKEPAIDDVEIGSSSTEGSSAGKTAVCFNN